MSNVQINTTSIVTAGLLADNALFDDFLKDFGTKLARGPQMVYMLDNAKRRENVYHGLVARASNETDVSRKERIAAVLVCHVSDIPMDVRSRLSGVFNSEFGSNSNRLLVLANVKRSPKNGGSNKEGSPETQAERAARDARRKANQDVRAAASLRKGPSGGGSGKGQSNKSKKK